MNKLFDIMTHSFHNRFISTKFHETNSRLTYLRPFEHYFSHIMKMDGNNERLCAMEPRVGQQVHTDAYPLKCRMSRIY